MGQPVNTMEYEVLVGTSPSRLAKRVNDAMGEGWCLGMGFSIAPVPVGNIQGRAQYLFAQPMTRMKP